MKRPTRSGLMMSLSFGVALLLFGQSAFAAGTGDDRKKPSNKVTSRSAASAPKKAVANIASESIDEANADLITVPATATDPEMRELYAKQVAKAATVKKSNANQKTPTVVTSKPAQK